jgi:putative oxidoreductase
MSAALLAVRLVVGLLFAGHGSQKLFGWFGGHGLRNTAGFFEKLGFRPGLPLALLAGLAELGGGLLFAAGLFVPAASLLLCGVMATAIAGVHWSKGIWNQNGGLEFPLVLGTVAFAVAATGPGRLSLDHAFGLDWHGIWWALGAAGLGALGGLLALVPRHLSPARENRLREAA